MQVLYPPVNYRRNRLSADPKLSSRYFPPDKLYLILQVLSTPGIISFRGFTFHKTNDFRYFQQSPCDVTFRFKSGKYDFICVGNNFGCRNHVRITDQCKIILTDGYELVFAVDRREIESVWIPSHLIKLSRLSHMTTSSK